MTFYSAIGETIYLLLLLAAGVLTVWLCTFIADIIMWLAQNFLGLCIWIYIKARYVWFKK